MGPHCEGRSSSSGLAPASLLDGRLNARLAALGHELVHLKYGDLPSKGGNGSDHARNSKNGIDSCIATSFVWSQPFVI
jgi:hypothetical protein